jgi:hypothetical protein
MCLNKFILYNSTKIREIRTLTVPSRHRFSFFFRLLQDSVSYFLPTSICVRRISSGVRTSGKNLKILRK